MSERDLRPSIDARVWGILGRAIPRPQGLPYARFGAPNARGRRGLLPLYRGRLPPPPSKVAPTRRLGPFSHGIRVGPRPQVGCP